MRPTWNVPELCQHDVSESCGCHWFYYADVAKCSCTGFDGAAGSGPGRAQLGADGQQPRPPHAVGHALPAGRQLHPAAAGALPPPSPTSPAPSSEAVSPLRPKHASRFAGHEWRPGAVPKASRQRKHLTRHVPCGAVNAAGVYALAHELEATAHAWGVPARARGVSGSSAK